MHRAKKKKKEKKTPDVSHKEESCSGVRAGRRSLTNTVIESSSLKGHGGGVEIKSQIPIEKRKLLEYTRTLRNWAVKTRVEKVAKAKSWRG